MSRDVAHLAYTYCSPSSGSIIIGPKCHMCMNKEYRQHSLNDVGVVYVSSPTGLIPFPIRALMFCNGYEAPFTMKSIAENMVAMDCTNCGHISNTQATADKLQRSTTSVIDATDQNSGSNNILTSRKKKRSANKEDVNNTSSIQDNIGLSSLPPKRIKLEELESQDIFIIENPGANNSVPSPAANIFKDANGPMVPLSSNSTIVVGSESRAISTNEVLIATPAEPVLVTACNVTFDAESGQIMNNGNSNETIEEHNDAMHTSASSKVSTITVWVDSGSSLSVSSDSEIVIDSKSDNVSANIPRQVDAMRISASNATVGKGASNVQDVKSNPAGKTSASRKKKITDSSFNDFPFVFGRKPSEVKDILTKEEFVRRLSELKTLLKPHILARIIKSYFPNQDTLFCSHCQINLIIHQHSESILHLLSRPHITKVYANGLAFCGLDDLLKFIRIYNGIDSELSGTVDSLLDVKRNQITDKAKSNVFIVDKSSVQQMSSSQVNNISKGVLKGVASNARKGIPVYIKGLPFAKGTPGELTAISFSKIYNYIACLQDVGGLGSDFEEYIVSYDPAGKNVTHCYHCGRIDSSVAPGHRYFSHFLSASHIAEVMKNNGGLSRDWNQFMTLLKKFLLSTGRLGRFALLKSKCKEAARDCTYSSKDSAYKRFEESLF